MDLRVLLRRKIVKQNNRNEANTAAIRPFTKRGRQYCSMALMLALLFLVAFLSMACLEDTGRDAVKEVLNRSMERDTIFLHIALGRVGDECGNGEPYSEKKQVLPSMIRFHAAQKAGLITISPDGPGFWKVDIVDPKPGVVESLKRMKHNVSGGCDAVAGGFPLAERTVVEVVKMNAITSEKSEVAFTWKWTLTPFGAKIVNGLTEPERSQLNSYLHPPNDPGHTYTTFNLADLTMSTTPHSEKKALKKSGDSWVLDE